VDEQPDEDDTTDRQDRQGHSGESDEFFLLAGQLCVHGCQGEVCVYHAQNPPFRRMGMASGIGTGGGVFYGPDQTQYPLSLFIREDSGAVGPIQASQRSFLGVAYVAGFGPLIDQRVDLLMLGGVADAPFFVEYPDAADTGFIPDRLNHFIESFSVIAKHQVMCAPLDDIADSIGTLQDHLFGLPPLQTQIHPAENREQGHGTQHYPTGKFYCQ
jgi:hypothetical protein